MAIVGLVPKTNDPVPVLSVITAAKLDAAPEFKNVETPVARSVTPVPPCETAKDPVLRFVRLPLVSKFCTPVPN